MQIFSLFRFNVNGQNTEMTEDGNMKNDESLSVPSHFSRLIGFFLYKAAAIVPIFWQSFVSFL